MNLKKLLLFGLLLFFIFTIYTTRIETMYVNKQIVLMGDSILDNSAYVASGDSVYEQLKNKTNNNVLNVAKDHSTIVDLYSQLDKVPIEMNTSNTYVFISAGGNNILTNSNNIDKLSQQYGDFLNSLKTRLPNVKLFLFNLYVPINSKYSNYKPIIENWNNKLTNNKDKYNYEIKDLFNLLVSSDDFVYDIEPSETASKKIVELIINS